MTPKAVDSGVIVSRHTPFPDALVLPDEIQTLLEQVTFAAASARHWRLDPWFEQGPRLTTDSNWQWICRGRGQMIVGTDQMVVDVAAGDLVLLPSGTLHTERFFNADGWEVISVHFAASVLEGVDLLRLLGAPIVIRAQNDPRLADMFERMVQENELQPAGWRRALGAEIASGMFYLLRHYGSLFRPPWGSGVHRELLRLVPAFVHIDKNWHDRSLTVGDLAQCCQLSEVQFRRVFKRATQTTPVAYVRQRRVAEACRLLERGARTADVAAACGFADLAFFHRVFKSVAGITPARYRARY